MQEKTGNFPPSSCQKIPPPSLKNLPPCWGKEKISLENHFRSLKNDSPSLKNDFSSLGNDFYDCRCASVWLYKGKVEEKARPVPSDEGDFRDFLITTPSSFI